MFKWKLTTDLNLDSTFNVIEERPSTHILKDGVSVKLSSNDYQWCVNCWVYFIVNVIDDRRVYATARSFSRTLNLRSDVNTQLLINEGQTECFAFSVGSMNDDLVCQVNNFQGNADLFLGRRTEPTSISSSSVRLIGAKQHPQSSLIAKVRDRSTWQADVGTYYLCFRAYSAVSAQVIIK